MSKKKKPVRWWATRNRWRGAHTDIWSGPEEPHFDERFSGFFGRGTVQWQWAVQFRCPARKSVVPFPIKMGQCIEIEPPVLVVKK